MNAQEKTALQDFLQEMNRVRLERKDLEADAMIRQAAQQQPDALYLLTQRALLQEQALQAAQQKIAELQNQVRDLQQSTASAAAGTSFLDSSAQWGRSGHALGGGAPAEQGAGTAPVSPQPSQPSPPPQWQGQTQASPLPGGRPGLLAGGGGSFLGSMAGVLAGAAAGNFLYQGIEHMLHRDQPQPGSQNLGDLNQGQGGGLSADNPLARDAGVADVGAASRREPQQWDDVGADDQDDLSDTADGGDFLDGDDGGGDDYA